MEVLPHLTLPEKEDANVDKQNFLVTEHASAKSSMLVWHQIEATSWIPAATVGHRGDVIGKRLFIFGGLEVNARGNQVLAFDIEAAVWEKVQCTGSAPCARAWHATTVYSNYLIIHGGEGETSEELGNYKLFPGDDLDQASHKMTTFADDAAKRACLDDLWLLDTSSMRFLCIASQLAPLPRKQHGIAVADFESLPYLFLFGGFSLERDVVSGGLFLVDMQSVLAGRGVWRSAVTTGAPPAPRQQHSLIAVNEETLMIYGGLGADQNPLRDIVLLATDTMVWSHPNVNGIPAPALFGHAAVIVHSSTASPLLLVFGGATSNSDKAVQYSNKLYSCDLNSFEWSQVSTGYLFPSPRFGHVLAVVQDWAPTNHAPAGGHIDSEINTYAKSAAILFGGMNYKFCKSEAWVLDLRWRKTGVDQFDGTQAQAIDNEMKGLVTRPARSMSLPFSSTEESSQYSRSHQNGRYPNTLREVVQQQSLAHSHHEPSVPNGMSQDFAMQVKKETIVAHLEVSKERAMRIEAQDRVAELTAKVEQLTDINNTLSKQHVDEVHQLRTELEEAHAKIANLETLKQEAYHLLQLLDARQTSELCDNFLA